MLSPKNAAWDPRPCVPRISGQLTSMIFNLAGRSTAVIFAVAYIPTDTPMSREERDMSWTGLDSTADRVLNNKHLFILMDANARTGVRIRQGDYKTVRAYSQDSRATDSNGTLLLQFTDDNRLALVSTFCSPLMEARRVCSMILRIAQGTKTVLPTSSRGKITAGFFAVSRSTFNHPTRRTLITKSCAP